MFAFSGLHYTESLTGKRNWTYDTPDELDEVMSPGYMRGVCELFEDGDSLHINATDEKITIPISGPDCREAPSALLH